jgi:malonyl CoA-acyl carrier protein transacylase
LTITVIFCPNVVDAVTVQVGDVCQLSVVGASASRLIVGKRIRVTELCNANKLLKKIIRRKVKWVAKCTSEDLSIKRPLIRVHEIIVQMPTNPNRSIE